MSMHDNYAYSRSRAGARRTSRATFSAAEARGPIIDQEGREVPRESLRSQSGAFHFDFAGRGIWIGLSSGLAAVAVLLLIRWLRRDRLAPAPHFSAS